MTRIYKYKLAQRRGAQRVSMHGPHVLAYHLGVQDGELFVWAEVDSNAPLQEHVFVLVFTGDEVPEEGGHIGTVQFGSSVWHLYQP